MCVCRFVAQAAFFVYVLCDGRDEKRQDEVTGKKLAAVGKGIFEEIIKFTISAMYK